jgi:hypothetical protein
MAPPVVCIYLSLSLIYIPTSVFLCMLILIYIYIHKHIYIYIYICAHIRIAEVPGTLLVFLLGYLTYTYLHTYIHKNSFLGFWWCGLWTSGERLWLTVSTVMIWCSLHTYMWRLDLYMIILLGWKWASTVDVLEKEWNADHVWPRCTFVSETVVSRKRICCPQSTCQLLVHFLNDLCLVFCCNLFTS